MALTNLTNVKLWLNTSTTSDDQLLRNLIGQLSAAVLNFLKRPNLFRASYPEVRNGVGNQRMTLRNWPVISLTSVNTFNAAYYGLSTNSQNSLSIPVASSFGSSGAAVTPYDGTPAGSPQEIVLNGYCFPRGAGNVQIVYQAGYSILNEPWAVPTGLMVTVLQPSGSWMQDDGVAYASGVALAKVTGTPSVGQYVVDNTGIYTFASGDIGAGVLISYSYVPSDVENACIEWIGERYRTQKRIGEASHSIGGQVTTAFTIKKIPDHVAQLLTPFMKQVPI